MAGASISALGMGASTSGLVAHPPTEATTIANAISLSTNILASLTCLTSLLIFAAEQQRKTLIPLFGAHVHKNYAAKPNRMRIDEAPD